MTIRLAVRRCAIDRPKRISVLSWLNRNDCGAATDGVRLTVPRQSESCANSCDTAVVMRNSVVPNQSIAPPEGDVRFPKNHEHHVLSSPSDSRVPTRNDHHPRTVVVYLLRERGIPVGTRLTILYHCARSHRAMRNKRLRLAGPRSYIKVYYTNIQRGPPWSPDRNISGEMILYFSIFSIFYRSALNAYGSLSNLQFDYEYWISSFHRHNYRINKSWYRLIRIFQCIAIENPFFGFIIK